MLAYIMAEASLELLKGEQRCLRAQQTLSFFLKKYATQKVTGLRSFAIHASAYICCFEKLGSVASHIGMVGEPLDCNYGKE